LPTPVTVSVLPEMVPAPVLVVSTVKTTGLADPPPVAMRAIVNPLLKETGDAGAVKLIVCPAVLMVRVS
jgi:hypothetical protein